MPVIEDVVVVPVVDDEDAAGLDELVEVLDGRDVLPLVAELVGEMREGVAHADERVEAADGGDDLGVQGQPVGLLDDCERKKIRSEVNPSSARGL